MRIFASGWMFEGPGPDTSVGIFGYLVTHLACQDDEDNLVEAEPSVTITASTTASGIEDVETTYRCPKCGASASTRSQEPVEGEGD